MRENQLNNPSFSIKIPLHLYPKTFNDYDYLIEIAFFTFLIRIFIAVMIFENS